MYCASIIFFCTHWWFQLVEGLLSRPTPSSFQTLYHDPWNCCGRGSRRPQRSRGAASRTTRPTAWDTWPTELSAAEQPSQEFNSMSGDTRTLWHQISSMKRPIYQVDITRAICVPFLVRFREENMLQHPVAGHDESALIVPSAPPCPYDPSLPALPLRSSMHATRPWPCTRGRQVCSISHLDGGSVRKNIISGYR